MNFWTRWFASASENMTWVARLVLDFFDNKCFPPFYLGSGLALVALYFAEAWFFWFSFQTVFPDVFIYCHSSWSWGMVIDIPLWTVFPYLWTCFLHQTKLFTYRSDLSFPVCSKRHLARPLDFLLVFPWELLWGEFLARSFLMVVCQNDDHWFGIVSLHVPKSSRFIVSI